jgi:hypothetical protein
MGGVIGEYGGSGGMIINKGKPKKLEKNSL